MSSSLLPTNTAGISIGIGIDFLAFHRLGEPLPGAAGAWIRPVSRFCPKPSNRCLGPPMTLANLWAQGVLAVC
jgi:hypothetical protein